MAPSPLLKKTSVPSIDQTEARKKEELKNTTKIVEQIKIVPAVEKKETAGDDKKIRDLLEATKQDISVEVEEISIFLDCDLW